MHFQSAIIFFSQQLNLHKRLGLWISESSVEVILAFNRCLFFAAPNIGLFLFGSNNDGTGYRTWFWMVPPILWGLWYFVRERNGVFSSIQHIETENPHLGYFDAMAENVSCFNFCTNFNQCAPKIAIVKYRSIINK